jgi:hypothetical protein
MEDGVNGQLSQFVQKLVTVELNHAQEFAIILHLLMEVFHAMGIQQKH